MYSLIYFLCQTYCFQIFCDFYLLRRPLGPLSCGLLKVNYPLISFFLFAYILQANHGITISHDVSRSRGPYLALKLVYALSVVVVRAKRVVGEYIRRRVIVRNLTFNQLGTGRPHLPYTRGFNESKFVDIAMRMSSDDSICKKKIANFPTNKNGLLKIFSS